jgi:hypothetical protein
MAINFLYCCAARVRWLEFHLGPLPLVEPDVPRRCLIRKRPANAESALIVVSSVPSIELLRSCAEAGAADR